MNMNKSIIDKLRKELVDVSKKIYVRGLTSGISGNISARLQCCPDQVLIKASGKCLGDVCTEDFILVDLDGNVLDGNTRPSVEVFFHCGIYKVRPEVSAVVHGHSPWSTAYVASKGDLPIVTAAIEAGLNKVGIIQYAEPGSDILARYVTEAFSDSNLHAAFLKKHGFITVGKDIQMAYYLADMLEDNAKVACLVEMLK